jgi:hypothetical protein
MSNRTTIQTGEQRRTQLVLGIQQGYTGWTMNGLAYALNATTKQDAFAGWREIYAKRVSLVEQNPGNPRLDELAHNARHHISALTRELSHRQDGELLPSGD